MLVNQNSWAKVTKIKYDEKKNSSTYTYIYVFPNRIYRMWIFFQTVRNVTRCNRVGPFFLRQFENDGWWFILKCFLSSRNGILNIVTGNREETSDRRWTHFFFLQWYRDWKKKHLGKDHSVVILIERFSRKVLGHLNSYRAYLGFTERRLIFRRSSPWSQLLDSESKTYSYISFIPDLVDDLVLLCNVSYRYPVPITLTISSIHIMIIQVGP